MSEPVTFRAPLRAPGERGGVGVLVAVVVIRAPDLAVGG
jgi:hypothetical protein